MSRQHQISTKAESKPAATSTRSRLSQSSWGDRDSSQPSQPAEAPPILHEALNLPIGSTGNPIIQPKLMIGAVGDKYEQEADRVATQVVNQINAPQTSYPGETLQRHETEEDENKLQMKPLLQNPSGGVPATPELEAEIGRSRGGGQPLDETIRRPMEQAFGADFSRIKVHTDAQSDQLNRSIQASAFTNRQDIFFRQGAYQPGSRGGQELIAHELSHVGQQRGPEAISRKFIAHGWTNPKQDSPLVLRIDSKPRDIEKETKKGTEKEIDGETRRIIQEIVRDPKSISALNEIAKYYEAKYEKKKETNFRIRFLVSQEATSLHESLGKRYEALANYAQESHDTGIVYKGSYPHLYFLWVNCITSKLGLLPEEASKSALPEEEVGKSAEPKENHYDTVILGVGAAAGYYIMGNLATMAPDNTAIIGYEQPWDEKSECARAIAINHENQAWTTDPTASGLKDSDDKRSQALTQELEKVRKAVTWKNAYIEKTEKDKDGGYTVTYKPIGSDKEETLHAEMVVSALGGGTESLKKNEETARNEWEKKPKDKLEDDSWKPVFTLNEFQRWLRTKIQQDGDQCLTGKRVIVVGANAGVDAAYTCTRAGGKLLWYVGSGMAYAAAMKNTDIAWENVEAVLYGYGDFVDVKETEKGRIITAKGSSQDSHKEEVKKMKEKDSPQAQAFDRVSGGKWAAVKDKISAAAGKPEAHLYVSASGQDDTNISAAAGVPSGSKGIKALQDAKKTSSSPVLEPGWERLRVVYSDGRISSKLLVNENGQIDSQSYSTDELQKAASKRRQVSYDSADKLSALWAELAPQLEDIAQKEIAAKVDFTKMDPSKFVVKRDNGKDGKEEMWVPQEIIQAVAVYQLGEGEDKIGSINTAKKGILIVGAQARPYIQAAGYKLAAVDQVEQIVDIGQITPARQAIEQVTHIAVRGAMGKADYTYGTREEIAATVAAHGLRGMKADLITEAIIWSRKQPGLGEVRVDPKAKDSDERLAPAPRTARMKKFWDAVLRVMKARLS